MLIPIRAAIILVSLATLAMGARAQTGATPQSAPPASPVGSIVQNSTGTNSTNIGIINGQVTINNQDPGELAAMTKVFADQTSANAADKATAEVG